MQSPFLALHRKMPIADVFSFTSHFLIALPRFSVRFRQVVYHTSGKYSKFLYEVLKKTSGSFPYIILIFCRTCPEESFRDAMGKFVFQDFFSYKLSYIFAVSKTI